MWVADCFAGTLRLVLFALNFCTLLAGGIVLGCGVYIKVWSSGEFDAVYNISWLDAFAYIMIGLGLFVILISLMGCLGACLQNHVLLSFYFILVLLLVLCEVGTGILFAVEKTTIETSIDKTVKELVQNYEKGTGSATAVDAIQETMECCGYDGPADYGIKMVNLPASCCKTDRVVPVCIIGIDSYSVGCKEKVASELEAKKVLVIIVVSAVIVLEVVTMLMTCYLRKQQLQDIDDPPYTF